MMRNRSGVHRNFVGRMDFGLQRFTEAITILVEMLMLTYRPKIERDRLTMCRRIRFTFLATVCE